jgi:Uma2 family endonuclease
MSTTTHLMTADELFNLPDDSLRHELIKGELLTMSPAGFKHDVIGTTLALLLFTHVRANNLGIVVSGDTGFKLESDPDTVLAPDGAFIARERVGVISEGFFSGPPDLAIEVRSPSDRRTRVERKAALWLSLGAKSVWLVEPRQRTVEVIRADGLRRLFHESDELVDDTVPGFRVPVSEIFN